MDDDDINDLIQICRKLKNKFCGVFAANNFPQKLHKNSFLTVNASPSNNPGTHWLLLCNGNNKIIYADPLRQSIFAYRDLYHRLSDTNAQICQFLENQPIQSQNSELCGLFCIYIAHVIFSERQTVKINDVQLLRFALHMMFYYLLNKFFFSKFNFSFKYKTNKE